jgi:Ca2+-binding EF-hand superfamily protein
MDGEFRKMDGNNNGQVTRAEADAYQLAAARAAAIGRARTSFLTLDRNKDGKLSLDEFLKLVPIERITGNGERLIAVMDSSRDGQVSLIEHRTATLANFDRIDADKDGIASPAEMQANGVR